MDLITNWRMLNRLIAFVVIIAGSATAQTPWVWQSVNLHRIYAATATNVLYDEAERGDIFTSNALYFGSRKNGLWLKKGAAVFVEHGNKKYLTYGRVFDTYGRILTAKSKNSRCPDGIVIYAK